MYIIKSVELNVLCLKQRRYNIKNTNSVPALDRFTGFKTGTFWTIVCFYNIVMELTNLIPHHFRF